jgi:hypothetical protein
LRRLIEAGGIFTPLLEMHEELLTHLRANNVTGAIAAVRAVFEHLGSFFAQP